MSKHTTYACVKRDSPDVYGGTHYELNGPGIDGSDRAVPDEASGLRLARLLTRAFYEGKRSKQREIREVLNIK